MREGGSGKGDAGGRTLPDPFPFPLPAARRLFWRLAVDRTPRSGPDNMALDWGLLDGVHGGVAWLRLYQWDPPCLSFGRHEPALARYDRARIEGLGLAVVRRPTGGRAVWHDREVTYAVAAPVHAFGTLAASYRAIHTVIAAALQALGIRAGLAPRPAGGHPGPGAGACFAFPAGGEVVVNGRKLVGSAQVRARGALLQHGSILLRDGQHVIASVTRGGPATAAATSLEACLGRAPSFDAVAAAIAGRARAAWGGDWDEARAAPHPALVTRFADPAWTWRR